MEEMMEYEYQAHLQKQKQQPPPVVQQQQQQQPPERRKAIRKPPSIHDAAYSGDLRTVQTKLQENGALINLRNPIVSPPSPSPFFFPYFRYFSRTSSAATVTPVEKN
jgi:hypothetical protein